MTYCVGVLLNDGIVLLSDTRTNAGFDNIASYKKMFVFEAPGERVIALMTAGSLSVTQTVIARLRDAIDDPDQTETPSIMKAATMLEVAQIVGDTLSRVTAEVSEKLERMKQGATASMILAGQRKGGGPRMFLIYPEGNFIEATEDTPFLQIGECGRTCRSTTRARHCCSRWIRRCVRICRWGCRSISPCCARTS